MLAWLATERPHAYGVILADPPWHYTTHAARIRKHYRLMTNAGIAALPVSQLAARDSVLALWATLPNMPAALATMDAWGYRYVSGLFTWVKLNRDGTPFHGCGNYTRANAELCLLGVKGHPKVNHRYVSSVLLTHRRAHSRKPDQQYGRIEALFAGPYLEVFGRQCWPGWDSVGDQAHKFAAQPFLMASEATGEES